MREIDDMIRRLRTKGIQVEKVKMPKETTIEKKWMYQAGKRSKPHTVISMGIHSFKKTAVKTYSLFFGTMIV